MPFLISTFEPFNSEPTWLRIRRQVCLRIEDGLKILAAHTHWSDKITVAVVASIHRLTDTCPMLVIRPVTMADLEPLEQLASQAGVGSRRCRAIRHS